jgi:hypothetical protein
MPQWLIDLVREILTDILRAELEKHGVVAPAAQTTTTTSAPLVRPEITRVP